MAVTGEISPILEPSQANVSQHLPSSVSSLTFDRNPQRLEVKVIYLEDSDETTLNEPSDSPAAIDNASALTHQPSCDDLIAKLEVYQQWLENAVVFNGESWINRYREYSRKVIGRSIANKVLQTSDLFEDEVEARMLEIFKTRWMNAEDRRKDVQAAQDMATMSKRDLNGAREQLMAAQSAVEKATVAVVEANIVFAASKNSFKEAKRILFRSLSELKKSVSPYLTAENCYKYHLFLFKSLLDKNDSSPM
ncbi:hypothetical protein EC968_008103 [Mortierella alpina]|nr:hypothetical protein EC968_008103 [Mortierella alpina]